MYNNKATMVLKLFTTSTSPPVRSVLLTAKVLGITLELVEMDLHDKKEHLTPEYLQVNPQHTVPTLDDNGTIIWDSHAINIYLVTKYGKDLSLYPEDAVQRAIINQRLHFDTGVLFPSLIAASRPIMRHNANFISPAATEGILEAYLFLENFLKGHRWVAGDTMTLADLHVVATISTMDVVVPINVNEFPNICAWYKGMQALPIYEVNIDGLDKFKAIISAKLKKSHRS